MINRLLKSYEIVEGLHLISQNVNQQSSKSGKHTGRSRTPDLKDMTTLRYCDSNLDISELDLTQAFI